MLSRGYRDVVALQATSIYIKQPIQSLITIQNVLYDQYEVRCNMSHVALVCCLI